MVKKKDLKQLLNLNFTTLSEQTYSVGKYDLPYVICPENISIDYLALYSHVGEYNKTDNTAVCFYQYDNVFDGIYGIFNAIYYRDEKRLRFFKERFKNVKYFIAPDYSQCGDINAIENLYRIFKSRLVSLWFILELGTITIPNVTYANENYFDSMLNGMEDASVVAFSVKGSMKNPKQRELLIKAIRKTVDSLPKLKRIIVYSVCSSDDCVITLFEYAINKNIEVIIPDNILRKQNIERSNEANGKD
ncbi:MAG: DUF4417 domain-containing protein [Bacilli bacterium]|jgi:hypothetical protein|nr:DUF4417 domain-containing protein [Bacilli bacterium]